MPAQAPTLRRPPPLQRLPFDSLPAMADGGCAPPVAQVALLVDDSIAELTEPSLAALATVHRVLFVRALI